MPAVKYLFLQQPLQYFQHSLSRPTRSQPSWGVPPMWQLNSIVPETEAYGNRTHQGLYPEHCVWSHIWRTRKKSDAAAMHFHSMERCWSTKNIRAGELPRSVTEPWRSLHARLWWRLCMPRSLQLS